MLSPNTHNAVFVRRGFEKQVSSALCAGLFALGAGALSGCMAPELATGHIQFDGPGRLTMALVTTDAGGTTLRLRGCDLDIAGEGQRLQLNLDQPGVDEEEIVVDLPMGSYTAELVEGVAEAPCVIERLDNGDYDEVSFRQLEPLVPEVVVYPGQSARVAFNFELGGESVRFAPAEIDAYLETFVGECLSGEETRISCIVEGQPGSQGMVCVDGEMQADAEGCQLEEVGDSGAASCIDEVAAGACTVDSMSVSCCDSRAVEGGSFPMGAGSSEHDVAVSDFALDTFEVTVGRFRQFVQAYEDGWRPAAGEGANGGLEESHELAEGATGWKSEWDSELPEDATALMTAISWCTGKQNWTDTAGDGEQHPMNCVNWYEAFAFCAWDGGRLPTEAEWEYAAAGGSEDRVYPWGSEEPMGRANHRDDGNTPALEVGSYGDGVGRWGQQDLAGSVYEWTLDGHEGVYYNGSEPVCAGCTGESPVVRGGSYTGLPLYLRAAARNSGWYPAASEHSGALGLRCARDL